MTKVDRATMQVALEGREPFLDQNIIEFAMRMPDHLKIKDQQSKYLLRQILYKYVPKSLIGRPKQGFEVPLEKWLRNHLKEELEMLSRDKAFLTQFQLKSGLEASMEDFINQRKYVAPQLIWHIYVLYQWYKRWI